MDWSIKRYPAYYGGIKQTYPNIEPGKSFLSSSVVVGNLIFTSGIFGNDAKTGKVVSDDLETQVNAALNNIKSALEEAGSSLDNLVKHHILLKNIADSSRLWKTMLEYYQKNAPSLVEEPPAAMVSEVMAIPYTDSLVQISSIAVVSKTLPGWEVKKYPLYYGNVKQAYPHIQPGIPFMSESVVVGNLVFLSAMSGQDPETGEIETDVFEEQWKIALNKASGALDRVGSSLSNVVNTLHFIGKVDALLSSGQDVRATHSPATTRLWKTELEYFCQHAPFLLEEFPASSFLKISNLSDPAARGQTDITGVLSRFTPGWEVRNYPCYMGSRGFPNHISEIKKQFSNAVKIGNLVLIAGQTPVDLKTTRVETDDLREQFWIALQGIRMVAEESGCFLENLVRTHVLMPNLTNLEAFRKVELEFYQKYAPRLVEEPPATVVIHPLGLGSPKFGVEIEAIAAVKNP